MGKRTRIVLYALSLVTMLAMVTLIIFSHGRQSGEPAKDVLSETDISSTEEPVQIPEAEESEETEAADGQNRIQNDTEQEEADIAGGETDKQAEAGNTEGDGSTTLIFAGDVLFANAFKSNYDAGGIEKVIEPQLLQELQDADIFMVNNEFPFSNRGEPMEDKQFTFCCDPKYVKALNEMGVDVVSLANNHTLDYGREALSDTFVALDGAGILYGGAGDSAERAKQVQVIEANGKKYGFIAVSRVVPTADWKVENAVPGLFSCYDTTALVEVIKEARETCDYVAVYPHWGVEYQAYPEANQTQIAKACIDAGADVVVGSHTHCLQGVSYIDGKPVFYSLGNFIFGQSIDRSAMLEVTIDAAGRASYRFVPVYAAGGVTYPAEGGQAESVLNYLDGISEAAVASDGTVTED